MDNIDFTDRITILDNCNCLVCNKPILGRRTRYKKNNHNSLIETHFKLTHPLCERISKRLTTAMAKLDRAQEDILNWEFALFMLRES